VASNSSQGLEDLVRPSRRQVHFRPTRIRPEHDNDRRRYLHHRPGRDAHFDRVVHLDRRGHNDGYHVFDRGNRLGDPDIHESVPDKPTAGVETAGGDCGQAEPAAEARGAEELDPPALESLNGLCGIELFLSVVFASFICLSDSSDLLRVRIYQFWAENRFGFDSLKRPNHRLQVHSSTEDRAISFPKRRANLWRPTKNTVNDLHHFGTTSATQMKVLLLLAAVLGALAPFAFGQPMTTPARPTTVSVFTARLLGTTLNCSRYS